MADLRILTRPVTRAQPGDLRVFRADRYGHAERIGLEDWRAFAPSYALLRAGKRGEISWPEYAERYRGELRELWRRRGPELFGELLERCAEGRALVCFCPDAEECHRSVLAEVLAVLVAERGADVEVEHA